jgi:hypothetical protein
LSFNRRIVLQSLLLTSVRAGVAGDAEVAMQVRSRLFKSVFQSWESLCEEAAAFATEVGRDRLINLAVSHSSAAGEGVIFVWYWE